MTIATEFASDDKKQSANGVLDVEVQETPKAPKEFTDVVGGNGAWQIRILLLAIMSGIPVAWNHLAIPFLAFEFDHWCARPASYNGTVQSWWTEALPIEITPDDSVRHSQCKMFDFINSTDGNFSTIPCETFEFEEEDSVSIIKQWDLVCENEWMVSLSQSIYMAGFFAAVLLSGQLADTYGRHPIIMFNIVVLLISGIATAFATSFTMFTIMRFFVAMGQSGISLTVFVLVIETVGSKNRGSYSYMQGFGWLFGYCVLPLMGYYIRSWRILQLAITLPSIIFLSFYWLLPESPRWLLANGKLDKAIKGMEKAAHVNKVQVPDLETQAKKLCVMAEKENELTEKATVFDLWRTPNLRKKTINLYFCWMVIAFVYYGLSLNTGDLGGNFYLNFFINGVVEIPATLSCIYVTKRFGRKKPFMCTLIFCGLACIATIFVPTSIHWLKVTLAVIGKFLVSSAFNIVYIYSAEIYPTVARNVGVGSSSTMARVGSIVAPFMKELGKVTNPGVPMALFGSLSIISGCLVWLLPETTGFPVPETLQQAENFGKKEVKKDHELDTLPK